LAFCGLASPAVHLFDPGVLSENARTFIRAHIKTVWSLELLLHLHRHRERAWSNAELTRELRAAPRIIERGLAAFSAAGLLRQEGDGRILFAPANPQIEAVVVEVVVEAGKHPLALANEIYAADSRIQDFADAFKLRKE
jgi:hypothetical protein